MQKTARWVAVALLLMLLIEFPRKLLLRSENPQGILQPGTHFFQWSTYWSNLSDLWHRVSSFSPGLSNDGRNIVHTVSTSFGSSFSIILLGLLVVVVVGVTKGVFDGLNSRKTNALTLTSMTSQWLAESVPDFFIIITLELIGFILVNHGLQVYFIGSNQFVTGTFVPAVILAMIPTMYMARMVQRTIEEQFGQQYLVTAQAKGLPRRRIIWRHVFPNCLPTVLNALVPVIAMLFSNLVIVEYLFYRTGIVAGLLNAIAHRLVTLGPNPFQSTFNPLSFDPNLSLAYIVGCVAVFVGCWVVIRAFVHIMGYRGQSNPYTDTFREQTARGRIPMQFRIGFLLFSLLILLGAFWRHLSLPDPDKWDPVHVADSGITTAPYPPSAHNWFGTDTLGRDMLARAIRDTLPTFGYVALMIVIILSISTALALLSSIWRSRVTRFIIEVWSSLFTVIPGVIAALLILDIPDVYWQGVRYGSSVIYWTSIHAFIYSAVICVVEIGRVTHALQSILDEAENKSYMEAAEIAGNSRWTALILHHSRSLRDALTELAAVEFSRILLLIVSLGFFQAALQQKWVLTDVGWVIETVSNDWSGLISQNAHTYFDYTWVMFAPVLMVAISVIAVNLMLSGIRIMTQTRPISRTPSATSWTLRLVSATTRRQKLAVSGVNALKSGT